jgi:hypothetical protein
MLEKDAEQSPFMPCMDKQHLTMQTEEQLHEQRKREMIIFFYTVKKKFIQ